MEDEVYVVPAQTLRFTPDTSDEMYRREMRHFINCVRSAAMRLFTPNGVSTYSKGADRYPANAPRRAIHAEGAIITTEQGDYVDYVSALGAVILGYAHEEVDAAIVEQLSKGASFSIGTELENTLAERLCGLVPCAEMVRFAKNGADVTGAAVRIARAHTDRQHVLVTSDWYHGHHEWSMGRAPMNGGVLDCVADRTMSVPRFDFRLIETLLSTRLFACFIMEPVLSSDPMAPPADYFSRLRHLCDQYGTLLIFDELVTGWRTGVPGYPTGVVPDMACYGKAIANGMPLSVLAGPHRLIGRVEKDVFFSTTFGGECLSLAAANATIDVLVREDVPGVLRARGLILQREYNLLAERFSVGTVLYGYPQRPMMGWTDPAEKRVFLEQLIEQGILTQGYFNLTLAHDEPVLEHTIRAIERAFAAVAEAKPVAA